MGEKLDELQERYWPMRRATLMPDIEAEASRRQHWLNIQNRGGRAGGPGGNKLEANGANPEPWRRSVCSIDSVDILRELEDEAAQDVEEVWFVGGHSDIGRGWEARERRKSPSHIPLAWMVQEAMQAGLKFK